jgi:hypothetical protein
MEGDMPQLKSDPQTKSRGTPPREHVPRVTLTRAASCLRCEISHNGSRVE